MIRFWSKVDKRGPNECWLWTRSLSNVGYGKFSVANRKWRLAHVVAYEMYKGEIAEGLFVCHSCDNRACCNPSHLFLGTPAENTADMMRKGRHSHGTKHPAAKLSTEQVREIRELYEPGVVSMRSLGKRFGVAPQTICNIVNAVTYQDAIGLARWAATRVTAERLADGLDV